MNSLITGASGFVGTNLTEHFQKQGMPFSTISVRAKDAVNIPGDTTAIIHLAGKAHDFNAADPAAYFEANCTLTRKLYDAFIASDADTFIYLSSVKAVTDYVETALTEDAVPQPKTPYGRSKLEAETYIRSVPLPPGKSFFILRPCMIHGPGNKGNLNFLYKFVTRKIPWPLGAYENQRSFLSVENLCFVIQELLERKDIPAGVYHVADDASLSTNQLVGIIAEELGSRVRILRIPKGLIDTLAKVGDFIHGPVNSETLGKLTDNYVVSNQKLVRALQKPLPVTAVEGIRKTIRAFRQP